MPATFMESHAMLMVLRNLMKQAHERQLKGEAPAAPTPAKRRAMAGT
jgi:hypothetical protein